MGNAYYRSLDIDGDTNEIKLSIQSTNMLKAIDMCIALLSPICEEICQLYNVKFQSVNIEKSHLSNMDYDPFNNSIHYNENYLKACYSDISIFLGIAHELGHSLIHQICGKTYGIRFKDEENFCDFISGYFYKRFEILGLLGNSDFNIASKEIQFLGEIADQNRKNGAIDDHGGKEERLENFILGSKSNLDGIGEEIKKITGGWLQPNKERNSDQVKKDTKGSIQRILEKIFS